LTQVVQQAKKDRTLWSSPEKTQQLETLLSQLEAMLKG